MTQQIEDPPTALSPAECGPGEGSTALESPGESRSAPAWGALRVLVALIVAGGLVFTGLWLHEHRSRSASFVLVSGVAFGVLLQRSRFCFFCMLRDLFEKRDSRGALGILAALAAGAVGYTVVMGSMLPDPTAGWGLPGDAHIAPASWVILLGGAVFGIGMSLSGSCISAHLYRLGEGSLQAPVALFGTFVGFIGGFLAWNTLYVSAVAEAPVLWLPDRFGYALSLAMQLAALALLAVALLYFLKPRETAPAEPGLRRTLRAVFVDRWPAWIGGVGIGILGTFTFLRTRPLGVTAEINRLARVAGDAVGVTPARLEGLDRMRGCIIPDQSAWISENGIFVLALIAGSLVAALIAGQFRPACPSLRATVLALIGGLMLGFGAMVALGCTIGTLLSGIHAAAVAGWIFFAGIFVAVWITLPLRRWLLDSVGGAR